MTEPAPLLLMHGVNYKQPLNATKVWRGSPGTVEEASFINGAILPADGGRPALGQDPEEPDATTPAALSANTPMAH